MSSDSYTVVDELTTSTRITPAEFTPNEQAYLSGCTCACGLPIKFRAKASPGPNYMCGFVACGGTGRSNGCGLFQWVKGPTIGGVVNPMHYNHSKLVAECLAKRERQLFGQEIKVDFNKAENVDQTKQ